MKRIQKITMAFTLAAATMVSCSQGEQQESRQEAGSGTEKEPVEVMKLEPRTIARSVEYPATVKAAEEVHMVPASPGRIEAIFAETGDRVTKGTPLIRMDSTQLKQARIQLQNTREELQRLETLAETQSIARQQYDQLKTQYDVARSNVAFLADNTVLHAPFDGLISGRWFEPGEMYSGSPNTPDGKAAVLTVVQIDRLEALVPLSEKHFPKVTTNTNITVAFDVYPQLTFPGRINRIHPTIDPVNRTFNVEVLVSNSQGKLRPGMFSRITFDLEEVEAILVPSIAVLKMQGSNERYLFVNKNGTARRVSVKIGERFDDLIEVFSDQLKNGDEIVVTGQSRLIDGASLEIKN